MKITVRNNLKSTFKICKLALKSLEIEIDEIDLKNNVIYASTKSSFMSWGENVKIELKRVTSDSIIVNISSQAKAQIITWGKNDKNITEIGNRIAKISASAK